MIVSFCFNHEISYANIVRNNHNQITDGSHGNNDEKGNTYCAPVFEVYDLPLTEPSEDPINNQQEYRNELNELRG
ncbi:hypothetical protein DPMN_049908 [Dreissena polymorpha]|uniref:Uncharacterized protein n=1 Tax=Dreissena polymorpha TaxID=45954 RepID=A0A9D4HMJ3_DREPO|nr:hypothetical protein DPMN_049908 [Dreissena polymorpha]